MLNNEPQKHKVICTYCGDSYVNHTLSQIGSFLAVTFDAHVINITRYAPQFIRIFVDKIFLVFFEFMVWSGMARLSDDIDKAKTFRSRVIWEEARRRGIEMRQVFMFGQALDLYRGIINGQTVYFDSLPIPTELSVLSQNWDDKILLKDKLSAKNIPVPKYFSFNIFTLSQAEKKFAEFQKPVIVKPRVGSRGRHTVTNIQTIEQFRKAVTVVRQISMFISMEEHLDGDVCRATFVAGKLMGFYRGGSPYVIGDGKKTILELIKEKDSHRQDRVEKIDINDEVKDYLSRSGFHLEDILSEGVRLSLTYRTGRLFGGVTREMLDELHPSFVPILTEAAKIVGLPVLGFDCIVKDPTKDALTQRWGIIECNTLPFIDLHYYALEGKPKNIAGAIWDFWKK